MIRFSAILVACLALGACSTVQLDSAVAIAGTISAATQAACTDAQSVGSQAQTQAKGGALNTVNNLVSYVDSVCSTATTVAKAASDPSTVQWVSNLAGMLKAIVNPPTA